MKKKREIDYIECDGCQYMLDKHEKMIKLEIPIGPRVEVFHFHSLSHPSRSDCLRYWNLNPYMIKRTLQERGYLSCYHRRFPQKSFLSR